MGVERVDYYSDDEYNYASYLEEQQSEAMMEEEEIEEYHRNEYYKSLDKESTNVQ